MRSLTISLLLVLLAVRPAWADLDAAQLAYDEGRWEDAARQAVLTGDAEGYAFAAGALLAQLMTEPTGAGREALADRAFDLAEQANELDETHVDARLRLAASMGYRGRYMNSMSVFIRRMPQRSRVLLESAVTDAPGNAWAVGMLGAWHLEVARRGGSRGLDVLGASVEAGIGYYSNAIAMDPLNPAPRFFLAIGLLALDEPAYYEMAVEQTRAALALTPRDAFEMGILEEAQRLNELIEDRQAATAWADQRLRL